MRTHFGKETIMGRNSNDNSKARYEEAAEIANQYNDYLRHSRTKLTFRETSLGITPESVRYVNSVKKALNKLDSVERDIIIKEFFIKKDNIYWWIPFYSKTTYYRLRDRSIKRFLEVVDV